MVYELQDAQFPSNKRKHLYVPMRTTDGFVVVTPITQRNFENLCDALGHPEWKADPRLLDTVARRNHWDLLMDLIRDWTSTRSSAECERTLLEAGVPCSRYASVADVLADPHFRTRGTFATVDDGAGPFLVQNMPFRMSGADCATHAEVPALGEHTRSVLRELAGFGDERIGALEARRPARPA
jgi:CoA:oxalate CoA-transferase